MVRERVCGVSEREGVVVENGRRRRATSGDRDARTGVMN